MALFDRCNRCGCFLLFRERKIKQHTSYCVNCFADLEQEQIREYHQQRKKQSAERKKQRRIQMRQQQDKQLLASVTSDHSTQDMIGRHKKGLSSSGISSIHSSAINTNSNTTNSTNKTNTTNITNTTNNMTSVNNTNFISQADTLSVNNSTSQLVGGTNKSVESIAKQASRRTHSVLYVYADIKRIKVIEWIDQKQRVALNKEREIRHTHKGGWSQEKFQRFVDAKKAQSMDWIHEQLDRQGVIRQRYDAVYVESVFEKDIHGIIEQLCARRDLNPGQRLGKPQSYH